MHGEYYLYSCDIEDFRMGLIIFCKLLCVIPRSRVLLGCVSSLRMSVGDSPQNWLVPGSTGRS